MDKKVKAAYDSVDGLYKAITAAKVNSGAEWRYLTRYALANADLPKDECLKKFLLEYAGREEAENKLAHQVAIRAKGHAEDQAREKERDSVQVILHGLSGGGGTANAKGEAKAVVGGNE